MPEDGVYEAVQFNVDGIAPGFLEETLPRLGWIKHRSFGDRSHYEHSGRSLAIVEHGKVIEVAGHRLHRKGQTLLETGLDTSPNRSEVLDALGMELPAKQVTQLELHPPERINLLGLGLVLIFEEGTLVLINLLEKSPEDDHNRTHSNAVIDVRGTESNLLHQSSG